MMYNTWKEIAERVPDFSTMTNSVANNGNPCGSADYARNRNRILNTGIDIGEYEGGYSYHGKSILIDDDLSVLCLLYTSELKLVASALLPPETMEGTKLLYEWMQYSIME